MIIGDHVTIKIHDPEGWHRGAVAAMDGQVGTITTILDGHYAAGGRRDCPVLVTFDHPVTPWHSNARDIVSFHFSPEDLRT